VAFDEFRCVVVGNEPAGLWLLAQMEKAYLERGEEPRLGWISLGVDPAPVAIASSLGAGFGIAPGAAWSAEIVTPRQALPWTREKVAATFPMLPPLDSTRDPIESLTHPTSIELTAIRAAIAKNPELIGHAQGLWKALGRTQLMLPETVVHYSRFLTQLQWWSPERDLSPQIARITLDPTQNTLETFAFRRNGGFAMNFRQYGEVSSTRWIFNSDLRTLMHLVGRQRQFVSMLNLNTDPSTLQALYPLRLQVEADAIPSPVSPLTLYFDTELIPDPQTEIWPLTLRSQAPLRELTVWASAPGMVSLEAVLEALGGGLQRVQKLFPFLSQKLVQLSVPLGMETCFEVEQRRAVADQLCLDSQEQYRATGFYTATRNAALSLLLPYMGCHLPYPIGGLVTARKLLAEIVPKKKKTPTPTASVQAP
jgi:hypothetical protein